MPRSGGTMTIPNGDFTPGTPISSSDIDENFADIAAEITNSLALDGQSVMTDQLKVANGTVSLPGLTWGSDLDCGFYRIGANNIGLALNGAKVVDFLTTGVAITGTFSCSGTGTITGNGTVTGTLTVTGGFATAPIPASDDGAALGSTANKWADLFLASGSVINWNSGDLALTHTANVLTLTGGNLVVPSLTIGSNVVNGAVSTRQVLTSGSGATYTTPAGCRQLRVKLVGGGGGGGAAATNAGSNGSTTVFNDINASGGVGGAAQGGAGGNGGTGGGGTASFRMGGGDGGGGCNGASTATIAAGIGGSSVFGGAGKGSVTTATGGAGKAGTGGGGGGGVATNSTGGGGGGAGEYAEVIIDSPAATYTYTVGAGGAGGAAGTAAGGAGGIGIIIVDEFY